MGTAASPSRKPRRAPSEPSGSVRDRRRPVLVAALLLAATLAAYSPALGGGFIWDDDAHVSENKNLGSLEGLRRIWFEPRSLPQYYPLVHTTFWVEHRLWGLATPGYHTVNVLLHAATALLAGVVVSRLGLPGGLLAAAVFALHPVHVESVAWITERKNVLSGLFYLAALLAYLRFRPLDPAAGRGARPGAAYALACLLFACALLSKTVTCTLPAAILVLVWWKRGRISRADVIPLLPLFAAGLASGLGTAWLERKHVGAEGDEWALGPIERALIAGRALWFYVGKLVWPEPLAFVYPRWRIDPRAFLPYLFPAAALVTLAALWRLRDRIGRGPLAAALFFGGTLLPALGFFNIYPMRYSFVADHFQYLASLGPIVLGSAAGASRLRIPTRPGVRRAAGAAACTVLFLLGALTWRQAHVYRDLEGLWRDTLRKNPGAWMAHLNLGTICTRKGDLDGAVASYLEAIRLHPREPSAYHDLGNTLVRQGKLEAALPRYTEAVRLRPWFLEAQYNLGLTLAQLRRFAEAVPPLRRAAALDPGAARTHHLLAQCLAGAGEAREAVREYRSALAIEPDWGPALNDLAWLLATHPDPGVRDGREAVRLAERAAAALGAPDPNYLDTLAAAHAEAGEFDSAVRAASRAVAAARAAGGPRLAAEFEERLRGYREQRPHRSR